MQNLMPSVFVLEIASNWGADAISFYLCMTTPQRLQVKISYINLYVNHVISLIFPFYMHRAVLMSH